MREGDSSEHQTGTTFGACQHVGDLSPVQPSMRFELAIRTAKRSPTDAPALDDAEIK